MSLERLAGRSKTRMSDLSGDYEDMAVSVQGLGYLESGITEPLMRFERALVDFGANVKDHSASAAEGFLEHVHSLLAYSHSFKSVLKLRDQKQLDFEELSSYLSNVVTERDRLAGGYGYGMGIGSYLKERMESLRGGETDMSRAARLQRLDAKIKEVRSAFRVSPHGDRCSPYHGGVLTHVVYCTASGSRPPRAGNVHRFQRAGPRRARHLPRDQATRDEEAPGRVRRRPDQDAQGEHAGVGQASRSCRIGLFGPASSSRESSAHAWG